MFLSYFQNMENRDIPVVATPILAEVLLGFAFPGVEAATLLCGCLNGV